MATSGLSVVPGAASARPWWGCILAAVAGPALWLYRIVVHLALPVAGPVLWLRDRATGKSRPSLAARLGRGAPRVPPGGLWVQAVSVGEVEIARRVLAEVERLEPEVPVVVTATTATGLGLARRTVGRRHPVHPCPLDLPGPVARFLEAVRPAAVVLVETELWPELLHQAGLRRIPVAVVNGRLSDRSFRRYRAVRPLLGPLLEPVRLVLARSEEDAARFARLGIPGGRIRVTGNVKYDLEPDPEPLPWAERLAGWTRGRPVLVAGSTMEGEEEVVLAALERLGEELRPFPVLAPRHPERFDAVARLLAERGLAPARRSGLHGAPERPGAFLLDTIGELARAYRHAAVAFVGGSLVPTGGHNPLEAATWGVPVLTGPHVHNFREVYAELEAAGAVRVISGPEELTVALAAWLDEPAAARAAGAAGRRVVEANRGAAARAAGAVLELAAAGADGAR